MAHHHYKRYIICWNTNKSLFTCHIHSSSHSLEEAIEEMKRFGNTCKKPYKAMWIEDSKNGSAVASYDKDCKEVTLW